MVNDTFVQEQPPPIIKHSGLGIASFVIAIVQGFITAVVVIVAGVLTVKDPEQTNDMAFMLLGLFVIAGIFVHLTGAGLGIAGVIQGNRKKIFSILGLIFNVASLLAVAALMIIGKVIE